MKWDLKSILTLIIVVALTVFVAVLLVFMFIKDMLSVEITSMIITSFVLFATNIANYYFTRKEK